VRAGATLFQSFAAASELQSRRTRPNESRRGEVKPVRLVILLLLLVGCALPVVAAPKYKHKSEAEIARMTPAQRVWEYAEEQAHHKYDLSDEQGQLLSKYIWRDGLAGLPRMIEIMDEYDPTSPDSGGREGERFDAMWMLLADLDGHVVRLRASEEGRRAMDALERAIQRMRAAGYGRKDQQGWEQHGRFKLASARLEGAKGVNFADEAIRDTFWVRYKLQMSDQELLAFSNFLVERHPQYPGWSEWNFIKDYTRMNEAGYPRQVHTMKNPERFYEAYLEFKKDKSSHY
jgi:hypothetical protein